MVIATGDVILNILYKSKHFPGRHSRKREWVFFSSKHSVLTGWPEWQRWVLL